MAHKQKNVCSCNLQLLPMTYSSPRTLRAKVGSSCLSSFSKARQHTGLWKAVAQPLEQCRQMCFSSPAHSFLDHPLLQASMVRILQVQAGGCASCPLHTGGVRCCHKLPWTT